MSEAEQDFLTRDHPVLKWGTHQPLLCAAVAAATPGLPVLELGSGRFSTPLLQAICALTSRKLVTADNNAEWLTRLNIAGLGLSCKHETVVVTDWDAVIENFTRDSWGVVLVDHWPPNRRGRDVARLASTAEWLVLHDSEDPQYGYDLEPFSLVLHDDRFYPRTTLVSRKRTTS